METDWKELSVGQQQNVNIGMETYVTLMVNIFNMIAITITILMNVILHLNYCVNQ